MKLYELSIPVEARPYEMYWRNRIASRIEANMHDECRAGTHRCNSCEYYKEIIALIYQ